MVGKMPDALGSVLSDLYTARITPYTPDKLIAKGGMDPNIRGFNIYRDMLRDETVKVGLMLKTGVACSQDWTINPPRGTDPETGPYPKRLEFLTAMIEDLDFSRCVRYFCAALVYGYAICEKIYELVPGPTAGGTESEVITISRVMPKEPDNIDFEIDEFMDWDKLIWYPISNIGWAKGKQRTFPKGDFVHSVYNQDGCKPWGRSDLNEAYRPFWLKDFTHKCQAIFVEVFGMPSKIASAPGNTKEADWEDMLDKLKSWSVAQGFVLPPGWEIALLEVAKDPDAHTKIIEGFDRQISRAILGQHLTTMMGDSGGGSYALGKVQQGTFQIMTRFVLSMIEQSFNDLLDDVAFRNWAETGYRFKYKPYDEHTVEEWTRLFEMLTSPKFKWADLRPITDKIQEVTGIKGLELLEVREPQQSLPPWMPGGNGGDNGNGNKPAMDPTEEDEEQEEESAADYEEFAEMDRGLPRAWDKLEEHYDRPIASAFRDQFEQARKWASKRPEIFGPDARARDRDKAIEEFPKLNRKTLGDTLHAGMSAFALLGLVDLQKSVARDIRVEKSDLLSLAEYEPGDGNVKDVLALAVDVRGAAEDILRTPPIPKEVLALFDKRTVMTKAEWLAASRRLKDNAFFIAGDKTRRLGSEIRDLLTEILRANKLEGDFIARLKELELSYTGGGKVAEYHARTVFRNAATRAFNEERLEALKGPNLRDGFPMVKYSAIMDSRTTDICKSLNQQVFNVNDPDLPRPPNHHNCRSSLIPISAVEAREYQQKAADIVARRGDDYIPVSEAVAAGREFN